ncbi:haloacid dehalogenase superfamily, subfamily IA, variant 1 with third motif having Dx(3-4)D or Dx(3-4)E [Carnobacterium iners]|uniref:Haloacid dehalogenase superfamily, subfamily IA, variant 1 with third motif having Dx(3-4)D or Dx(3-4)E n=1 Tax=Carnobacterium iners TaxID=1073423 RepID=A0A1X7MV01_9LACT|nr:HAD-IA family hydrolase [Carnobacterium iners]SEL21687.1 haloacid dehalogenase superfamily, subfamily IA, variant 1 with third motif having Dx(3-4)D or Dx(3-4)E [Carnobacterium iners]SMH28693.1 haloacid dehalogenase superfamily, subfamily IA, variant 1 with third motif having Dx(3-4)D or Dx(3-4)E [Carnobacterium iners]
MEPVVNAFDMTIYPLMQIIKEEMDSQVTYDELRHYRLFSGLKVLELLGIKDVPVVYERWVRYVNEYETKASIYYNFEDIIRSFDNKVIQTVVSSKNREQYAIDKEYKKIHDCFSEVVLLEDTQKHKSNAQPLLQCTTLLGIDPKKCLYIGDSLSDFESAKNAEMNFAVASWGSLKVVQFKNPTYILKYPKNLLAIIS